MPSRSNSTQIGSPSAARASDVNVEVAGLLLDLSALQKTKPSGLGYKRAAYAVFSLERPVSEYVESGTLRDIRGIGPSSERIIQEWVVERTATRVDAAIAQATPSTQADIERRRAVREGFLSWAGVLSALARPSSPNSVSPDDYLGDFQMHTTWSDGADDLIGPHHQLLGRGAAQRLARYVARCCACSTREGRGCPTFSSINNDARMSASRSTAVSSPRPSSM